METILGREQQARLTAPDAVMAVAIRAASSDGRLRPSEIARLRLMTHVSPLFAGVEDVDLYLRTVAVEARRPEVLEKAARSLRPELRETAYAWAVEMAWADGKMRPSECEFLEGARQALQVHPSLASKIRAVVALRLRKA